MCLIAPIHLCDQFYDSYQFYCNMTLNDIWFLKLCMQNSHGKDPEWKGISVFSEPQVRLHSAKKISACLKSLLGKELEQCV